MRVQRYIIGSVWQSEGVIGISGIGDRECRQTVYLVMPGCRVVMPNVVGILLGKPDGAIGGCHNAHDARCAVRGHHLLKLLCMRIEDGEIVMTHFTEPEASLPVNGRAHQAASRLGESIFLKISCSLDGRCGI